MDQEAVPLLCSERLLFFFIHACVLSASIIIYTGVVYNERGHGIAGLSGDREGEDVHRAMLSCCRDFLNEYSVASAVIDKKRGRLL
ncbi:MAG: hypothetical protein MJA29_09110 [Candidatus Omnitrophica bacterium]|nr:hypothetical protein [Candidatus Omnitrophota bacterium]